MIKLQRGVRPKYLTDKKVEELTKTYKASQKSVWNKIQIKKPLSESSSEKCAYCESDLSAPSTYMEVEHFLPKSKHEDLVVVWDNLLPSCKRCNGTKNDEDILKNPIINPYDRDPRKHFQFDYFYIFGSTQLGVNTENTLNLNDETLFLKRCQVGGTARTNLVQIFREYNELTELSINNRKPFRAVLLAAQPDRAYSAFVATAIHTSKEYPLLKKRLIDEGLWTQELSDLDKVSSKLVLPVKS